MRESGDIHSHHGWLHLPDHKAGFTDEQAQLWQKAAPLFGDEPSVGAGCGARSRSR